MSALDVIAGRKRWACDSGPTLPWLRTLPDNSVHCVVTSPPYFGLRSYLPAGHPDKAHEIGTEGTPAEFVAALVAVFEECRRVLHPSGTFWLNIGDSYASAAGGNAPGRSKSSSLQGAKRELVPRSVGVPPGFKQKDLMGVPWMLAFALREAGWWLRAANIWAKPNAMTESVTDRPARAHEDVFLFSKRPTYFYDSFATRQRAAASSLARQAQNVAAQRGSSRANGGMKANGTMKACGGDTALLRSVWNISVARSKDAHFAVMPAKLAARCVLAGSSERGVCPACGEPWRRLTSKTRVPTRPGADTKVTGDSLHDGNRDPQRHVTSVEHVGWEAGCKCDAGEPVPSVVLEPFLGSGTTVATAVELGRRAIGCDLNPEYANIARRRVAAVTPVLEGTA